tara:strand:+ start:113 stop:460 length:348 start_codon:yes stop_codon:yes gene_type:complete
VEQVIQELQEMEIHHPCPLLKEILEDQFLILVVVHPNMQQPGEVELRQPDKIEIPTINQLEELEEMVVEYLPLLVLTVFLVVHLDIMLVAEVEVFITHLVFLEELVVKVVVELEL